MQLTIHSTRRRSLAAHCDLLRLCCFSGFPYEKVVQRTLYLQVLDYDRFSRNDPIGEVSVPLNKLDLANMQTFWKELKPCSDGSVSKTAEGLGEGRKEEEEQGEEGGGEREDETEYNE